MKTDLFRTLLLAIFAIALPLAASAKGELRFETNKVDFGTVRAEGKSVVIRFPFTNVGDEPVGIITVSNGGCGCTTPSFPKAPIKPGEKGEIVVKFRPLGFKGEVSRTVKMKVSSQKKRIALTFTGTVIP